MEKIWSLHKYCRCVAEFKPDSTRARPATPGPVFYRLGEIRDTNFEQ
jgi:hypothetical protein